jgi:hypothetical protein
MEEPASVNGGTFFTEAGNILMWTLEHKSVQF